MKTFISPLICLVFFSASTLTHSQTLTFKLDRADVLATREGGMLLPGPIDPIAIERVDESYKRLRNIPLEHCDVIYKSSVNMEGNKMRRLRRRFGWVITDSLQASNNKIRSIAPASLNGSMTYIDLSNNLLKKLPERFFRNQWLEYVDLSFNRLETLPSRISTTYMRDLNLAGNELSRLPSQANRLVSMERLDLSGNDFKTMPSAILRMKNLTYLDLSDNQLRKVPSSIRRLKNLRTLDLRGNEFDEKTIEKLTRIIRPGCELLI